MAAAALAAGLAAGHFLWQAKAPPIPTLRRLTFRRGNISTARFSPDGQSILAPLPRPLEGASEHGRGFGLPTESSDRIENEEEP